MKRILILSLLLLIGISAKPQSYNIQGGLTIANLSTNSLNIALNEEYNVLLGFHLGMTVAFKISNIFSLETGLLLDTKGTNRSQIAVDTLGNPNPAFQVNQKLSMYYITLPLMLVEDYYLKNGMTIYAGVGGYIAYGITGNNKWDIDDPANGMPIHRELDIEWGEVVNRLDYGLSFKLGVDLRSIYVGLGYDLGLANIVANGAGQVIKNGSFKVSLGYIINKTAEKQFLKDNPYE